MQPFFTVFRQGVPKLRSGSCSSALDAQLPCKAGWTSQKPKVHGQGTAPWAGVAKVLLPWTCHRSRAHGRERNLPTAIFSPCPQAVPAHRGTQPMGMHFQSFRFISTFHSLLQQQQHTRYLSHPQVMQQLCQPSWAADPCRRTNRPPAPLLPAPLSCLHCGL